jgi:ribonuclease T1
VASHQTLLLSAAMVVVALIALFTVGRCHAPSHRSAVPTTTAAPGASASATPRSGLPTIAVAELPPQALAVLALIDRGGPFRYPQDDTVFGNFEGLLPRQAGGYYREFTVPTPGSRDRGARRLIAGRLGDIYYTSDHYASFRQVIR